MHWLIKTSVLFFILLHCSYGITVTPTSFAASLALTTVLQLSIATSPMTSVDIVVTYPIETSLMIFTDIITPSVVFPIDTVTQIVLLTTDVGTINMSFTPTTNTTIAPSTVLSASTDSESIPIPDLTTLLVTTFESVSSTITTTATTIPVTTTSTSIILTSFTTSFTTLFTSSVSSSVLTSGTSLQSSAITSIVTTVITGTLESFPVITIVSTIPSPTPTVALPVLVVMRFNTSANVKRDASNYTDIESEIANATGIGAERIKIVTLIIITEVNEIVINAKILDLSSTEFTVLNDLFISRNVSITYQGMVYFSSSIMRQPPECSGYIERNYVCDAMNACPSNMMCQSVSNSTSQFCVPCQCNLASDNATCNDNCINNVCVPISSPTITTTISTNPTTTAPSSGGLSGRAIAGIVVGVTIPFVLICIFVVYCIHRRRKRGRYIPKQISMKKTNTYEGVRHRPVPPQWDSTIYRNTNEMFTLSQQLAEQDNEDSDKVQEYSMYTDL